MATLDDVMSKLDRIEGMVKALKGGGASTSASQNGNGPVSDTLPLDKLTNDWALKEVKKVPSNWKFRQVVGLKYDQLTWEEAESLASFFQWKSDKPQLDDDGQPKKMDNGKTWAEKDAFEAKLLRTWAIKLKSNGPGTKSNPRTVGDNGKSHDGFVPAGAKDAVTSDDASDDSIPF